ncbi:hypothetical protein CH63R_08613 [Colletotrichum higginsianum IMI 349063]|uniref:Uncharacterized protein n=2 Tax=Colletotrichum higginsianum TaxID=80884 RepID=A0A1B7Y4X9_COLHI|nr:hypothetical protein CH63R_08613 [Colletotrichum higginsianum IMI 349063]OBR07092.1 hypothetical protein CH63R_08613 [Colletotrichum higginsianum IMI 349063]TIC92649.1 hypothetical protein CH35J_010097 [Colletotrichum higginsianum]
MPRTRRPKLATEAEARQDEFKKAEALVNGKAEFKEAFTYHNRNKKRIAEVEADEKKAEEAQKKVAVKAAEAAKAIAFINGKAALLAKVDNQDKEEFKEAFAYHNQKKKRIAEDEVAEAAKAVAFINGKAFYVSRKAEGHEKKEFKEVLPPGFRSLGRDPRPAARRGPVKDGKG